MNKNKYALRQAPLAVTIGSILATGSLHAATITVNTFADTGYGPDCSLRSAIRSANTDEVHGGCAAGEGDDIIVFDPKLAASTISVALLPNITSNLIIQGPAGGITIDADNSSRIFHINGVNVELHNLTLARGRTWDNEGGSAVRAINGATLHLHDCVLSDNHGGSIGSGGAISVNNATLHVNTSTLSGNRARYGGAIAAISGSTVHLRDTTISGNSTWIDGGAIVGNSSTLYLENSTLSDNSAERHGGAIHFSSGSLHLQNSTLSGNSAELGGGAINGFNAQATLTHVTLTDNTAGELGSGIHSAYSSAFALRNSVIVGTCQGSGFNPTRSLGTDENCTGTATDEADIGLQALAANGGITRTHALAAGSVALSYAGNCTSDFGIVTDQRGAPRPNGTACDAGAFEYQEQIFSDRFQE